uniref:Ribosome biogenesis protein NOP53 n=1 Tax=Chromera velia CCMP2878 TaxID=1169474 RepID=A0A0G4G6S3_9ALVE|eukprot:Cvel_20556.t1-p1 / transcript=Cvel_20556.t1 / gene=Cvel_20556 / organism=Chromera_velia_CCMP2878 / gene_product=hypothetical protein / transcript_product=hypothetical protein / location=Cvel_scaffold1855:29603-31042(-) / protein_length=480 / sequence_SO=supercontig / SO=protein_coding / is_pseudo=false
MVKAKRANWKKIDDSEARQRVEIRHAVDATEKATGGVLFVEDTTGDASKITKSVRKEIKKRELVPFASTISKAHFDKLKKLSQNLPAKKAQQQKQKQKKGKNGGKGSLYDLWEEKEEDADMKSEETKPVVKEDPDVPPRAPLPWNPTFLKEVHQPLLDPSRKKPRETPDLHTIRYKHVPAVVLPQAGQAFNPSDESLYDALFAAYAVELEKERDTQRVEEGSKPMTNFLLDYFTQDDLASWDEVTKQRAFRAVSRGAEPEVVHRVISEGGEGLVHLANTGRLPDSMIEDGEGEEEKEGGGKGKGVIKAKPKEKKTTQQRNKEARRKILEEELRERRAEKAFNKAINTLPEILKEFARDQASKAAQEAYDHTVQVAKRRDEEKGDLGAHPTRIGRSAFKEAPLQVPLPGDLEESQGSLRRLRLGDAVGASGGSAAVMERTASIHRRALIEPPSQKQKKKVGAAERLKRRQELRAAGAPRWF